MTGMHERVPAHGQGMGYDKTARPGRTGDLRRWHIRGAGSARSFRLLGRFS